MFPRLSLLFAVVLLAGAGCSEEPDAVTGRGIRVTMRPFSVGALADYRDPGVYDDHRASDGVWLVADDQALVALVAACPVDGAGTRYDPLIGQYRCIACAARYTDQGIPRGGRDAAALPRCRVEKRADGQVWIDPAQRYRHEANEWSNPKSMVLFE